MTRNYFLIAPIIWLPGVHCILVLLSFIWRCENASDFKCVTYAEEFQYEYFKCIVCFVTWVLLTLFSLLLFHSLKACILYCFRIHPLSLRKNAMSHKYMTGNCGQKQVSYFRRKMILSQSKIGQDYIYRV